MKPLELVGNILGYIPGISTVIGIIKYFVYTSKARECEKERDEMARTAEKIDEIVTPQFRENRTERCEALDQEISSYKELAMWSGSEVFPFLNIFLSIFETAELYKLDKSRQKLRVAEQNENLDTHTKITNLEARMGVELPEEEGPKRDYCLKALAILDNLRIDGTHAIELKQKIYNDMESGWSPDGPQNVVGGVKECLHAKMNNLAQQLRLEPPFFLYDPRLHSSRDKDQFDMFVSIKIAIKTLDGIIAKDPEERIGVKLPGEEGPKRDYCINVLTELDTLNFEGEHLVYSFNKEKVKLVPRLYYGNQLKQLMYESIEKKLNNDDPLNHNAREDILQDLEEWNSRIRETLRLDEDPPNSIELEKPENQEQVKMLRSLEEAIRTINERISQEE